MRKNFFFIPSEIFFLHIEKIFFCKIFTLFHLQHFRAHFINFENLRFGTLFLLSNIIYHFRKENPTDKTREVKNGYFYFLSDLSYQNFKYGTGGGALGVYPPLILFDLILFDLILFYLGYRLLSLFWSVLFFLFYLQILLFQKFAYFSVIVC